jgi:8-oxo-dGTP pyrophosphatase MutT (NUDIX family)
VTVEPPAAPRDAATVVLLRDGARGVEAYLLRRVRGMAFAGGMTVFPGGSVDVTDAAADTPWAGPSPLVWAQRLGTSAALAGALVCAAVRETFEEAGVLIASPVPDGSGPDRSGPDMGGADWEAERVSLAARSRSLSELLAQRGLVLRADLLRAWSRWITPESEPRRFDTRFFVAALPDRQLTRDVGGEADQVRWMRPADALSAHRRGELPMLPPTAVTLDEMSSYASVAALLDAADERTITPIRPRIISVQGVSRVVLPGEKGYEP